MMFLFSHHNNNNDNNYYNYQNYYHHFCMSKIYFWSWWCWSWGCRFWCGFLSWSWSLGWSWSYGLTSTSIYCLAGFVIIRIICSWSCSRRSNIISSRIIRQLCSRILLTRRRQSTNTQRTSSSYKRIISLTTFLNRHTWTRTWSNLFQCSCSKISCLTSCNSTIWSSRISNTATTLWKC